MTTHSSTHTWSHNEPTQLDHARNHVSHDCAEKAQNVGPGITSLMTVHNLFHTSNSTSSLPHHIYILFSLAMQPIAPHSCRPLRPSFNDQMMHPRSSMPGPTFSAFVAPTVLLLLQGCLQRSTPIPRSPRPSFKAAFSCKHTIYMGAVV